MHSLFLRSTHDLDYDQSRLQCSCVVPLLVNMSKQEAYFTFSFFHCHIQWHWPCWFSFRTSSFKYPGCSMHFAYLGACKSSLTGLLASILACFNLFFMQQPALFYHSSNQIVLCSGFTFLNVCRIRFKHPRISYRFLWPISDLCLLLKAFCCNLY